MNITFDQCYHGCSIPVEIEKWSIDNSQGMKSMNKETIYVTIPPGIDSNEIIVLRNRGNSVNDQIIGDVKITIVVENTTLFKRNGLDLVYRASIPLKEALCGFAIEITHINGKKLCLTNHSNPMIIKPGYRNLLPQMGFNRDENKGNLVIEFDVVFPDSLTCEQMTSIASIL